MNKNFRRVAASLLAAGVLTAALAGCSVQSYSGAESSCKVTDKDRTTNSDGDSDARVYTTCGVFVVKDDIVHGQFNSSDTYASIQKGHTYDFEAYGPRNGFFSMFPNIIKATEVETSNG